MGESLNVKVIMPHRLISFHISIFTVRNQGIACLNLRECLCFRKLGLKVRYICLRFVFDFLFPSRFLMAQVVLSMKLSQTSCSFGYSICKTSLLVYISRHCILEQFYALDMTDWIAIIFLIFILIPYEVAFLLK